MGPKAYVLCVTLAVIVVEGASHAIYYVPQTGLGYLPATTSVRRVQQPIMPQVGVLAATPYYNVKPQVVPSQQPVAVGQHGVLAGTPYYNVKHVVVNQKPIKQQSASVGQQVEVLAANPVYNVRQVAVNPKPVKQQQASVGQQVEVVAANPVYRVRQQLVPVGGQVQLIAQPYSSVGGNYVLLRQQPVGRQGILESIWNFFGGSEDENESEDEDEDEDKPDGKPPQEVGQGGGSEGEAPAEEVGAGNEEPVAPVAPVAPEVPVAPEAPAEPEAPLPEAQPAEPQSPAEESEPEEDTAEEIPAEVLRHVFLRYYPVLRNDGEGDDGVEIGPASPGPSIAQAKPAAIALAGPGGVAAASPQGTAVVGPGGLAIAQPSATAVAGPVPPPPAPDAQTRTLMYTSAGHPLHYSNYPYPLVAYRF